MKKHISSLLLLIGLIIIFIFTVRGLPGNPTVRDLLNDEYRNNGPLELSPERGRFALTYSLAEFRSFVFPVDLARFVTPDVAYRDGQYVSLFAPGVSLIVLPGYFVGKIFGISQVGTFAVIAGFAIANFFLVRAISLHLGASQKTATIGSVAFLFATPAFAYAVNLYQHHISVFLILLSIYLLLTFKGWLSVGLVWLLYGIAIAVDYPNGIMMLPIAFYAVITNLSIQHTAKKYIVRFPVAQIMSGLFIFIPLVLFMWYNAGVNGSPLTLSGTLNSIDHIGPNGQPLQVVHATDAAQISYQEFETQQARSDTGSFFLTRNILNGIYIHFLSPDRGILYFAPVMFFAVPGIIWLYRKNYRALSLLLGVMGMNILLYSMWGDPWGGWAFGSRYLIPTYAIAGIFIALTLEYILKKRISFIVFFILLAYSIAVNALGAITTSKMPPQVQVLQLEAVSGKEEKYTPERNLDFILEGKSTSFLYHSAFESFTSPVVYYGIVLALVLAFSSGVFIFSKGRVEERSMR